MAYDDVDVVHDAALALRPGEITALVGPNGSGKSTLLRTLARLQRARRGTLTIDAATDGLALTSHEFARHVALLTQGRPTRSGLTVRDLVDFGRYPYRGRWGRQDPDGSAAVGRALGMTGAKDLAKNATWKSLPFVKAGDVHRLSEGIWMFGGPGSMGAYADALVDSLKK